MILSADSTANRLLQRALAAGSAVFDEMSEAILARLEELPVRISPTNFLAEAQAIIEDFTPAIGTILTDATLAGYLGGAGRVARMAEAPAEPPQGPPEGVATPFDWGWSGSSVWNPMIERAVEDLKSRNLVRKHEWEQLEEQIRARSFTVAYLETQEALERVRKIVVEAVEGGRDFREFSEQMAEALGEGALGLGHQENVFRTNVAQAYANGMDKMLADPLVGNEFPYIENIPIRDSRLTELCEVISESGLDGTGIYRRDDKAWQKFRVPRHFGDRCAAVPMSVREAARRGVREAQRWLETRTPPEEPEFVKPPDVELPKGWLPGGGSTISLSVTPRPHLPIVAGHLYSTFVGQAMNRRGISFPPGWLETQSARMELHRQMELTPEQSAEELRPFAEAAMKEPSLFRMPHWRSGLRSRESRESGFSLSASPEWTRYEGPHGGSGWKNSGSGEVRYQAEMPVEGAEAEGKTTSPEAVKAQAGLSSIGSMTWDKLKAAGVQVGHLEHVAKEWTEGKVGSTVARLPEKMQALVRGTWVALRVGLKASFATYTAGQALAEQVAKERGATPEQAAKIKAITSAIDLASFKPITIGMAAIGLGAAAIPASFVPVGSMTYLAYSTATDPMATFRGAVNLVRGLRRTKLAVDMALGVDPQGARQAIGQLASMVVGAGEDSDALMALVLAALDETGDALESLEMIRRATSKRPGGAA